jgi:predicted DNA-binding WGR domain protein
MQALVLTEESYSPTEVVSPEKLAQFTQYIRFASIDPTRNRFRFYTLTWQPGLWDEVSLVRSWGRIGKRGRSCSHIFNDQNDGRKEAARLVTRRLQRGYQAIDWR